MKLAIWADCHIGKKQYRTDENNYNKYEQIGYRTLKEYVKVTKAEKPDLIINAGDTFEVANPSVLAMTNYFNAMRDIGDIPTMTILGNHDFNFANKNSKCSAVGMVEHTYFADYEIKTEVINDILFVMMPYIYDTAENIEKYLTLCKDVAKNSSCHKKILVTHGVTEWYYKNSFISDPIMLDNDLIELFNLVIIGHIHTPYNFKYKNTIVISPGAMIDYQAYEDRTGPIILDTDTWEWHKIKIKTPHIVKVDCNETNINDVLKTVNEDIYQIRYTGNVDAIDNDLFIKAKNKAVNLIIDVVKVDTQQEEKEVKKTLFNLMDWVSENYSDYKDDFINAKRAITT